MTRRSSFARVTIGVFALALAARLVALLVYGPHLGGDSHHYLQLAAGLREGGPRAVAILDLVSAPLYPVFIALAGALVPDPVAAATLGQAVLGAATAALVVRITHRITASVTTAAIGGVVAALHPGSIFWGTYVLSETLFIFALAVCVDRVLAVGEARRPLIAGLAVGLAALFAVLARGTAAPFLAVLPVYALVALRRRPGDLARAAAGASAVVVVGIVAVLAAQGRGASFDLGARVQAYIWSAIYFGLQWNEHGRGTAGIDIIGSPPDGDARAAVLAWIAADPWHPVLQALRKLKMFWTPVLPEFSFRHALFALAYYLPFYALAIVGARELRHRGAALVLLLGGTLAFTLTAMITFVDYDQRFRLPAELLMLPLVGAGAAALLSRVRAAWPPRPAARAHARPR